MKFSICEFRTNLILVFLLLCFQGIAQNNTISGVVTSSKTPIPYAAVFIKGTNIGTSTNFNGEYSLKLNQV